jgi:hypothetical protein
MRYVDRRLAEIAAASSAHVARPKTSAKREYYRKYNRLRRQTLVGRREIARSNLRASHNLSLVEYSDLYRAQAGRCAICDNAMAMAYDPTRTSGKRGPAPDGAHIDHDHACCPGRKSCGRCVRGLLCARCSAGIERFRDNAEIMRSAADYVVRAFRAPLISNPVTDNDDLI